MQSVEHRYLFASLPLTTACIVGVAWLPYPANYTLRRGTPCWPVWASASSILPRISCSRPTTKSISRAAESCPSTTSAYPTERCCPVLFFLGECLNRRNRWGLALGALVILLLLWESLQGAITPPDCISAFRRTRCMGFSPPPLLRRPSSDLNNSKRVGWGRGGQ